MNNGVNSKSLQNRLSWNDLSVYRTALMGVAMIMVYLFHSIRDFAPLIIQKICVKGYVGVDVFLFLSSMGLGFSLHKNRNIYAFYRRRLFRIFPTYWFVMTCVYAFVALLTSFKLMPVGYWTYPTSMGGAIEAYTTLGYWLPDGIYYLWYVPAIIPLYLLFPYWFRFVEKSNWFILLCFVPVVAENIFEFNINFQHRLLYDRIGIFMFGAYTYKHILYNHNKYTTLSLGLGIIALIYYLIQCISGCQVHTNFVLENILFYLTLPGILLLLCRIFVFDTTFRFFTLVGTVSLEFYLIHEFTIRFVQTLSNYIYPVNGWCRIIISFTITMFFAYIIHDGYHRLKERFINNSLTILRK